MSDKDLQNKNITRSGLRLIVNKSVSKDASTEEAAELNAVKKPAAPKSNLAAFMTAYADAIDRDVEMILGL